MRRYIFFSSFLAACFLLASIGFSDTPVTVTIVKKLTPVDAYFTGKVESVESDTLGFGVDRGVVAETKKGGDIIVASVYNRDGSIAKKGTVVSRLVNDRQHAAYQLALLDYQNAKDTYNRNLKIQKSISKKDFENARVKYLKTKAEVLSAKADLDGTEIIAPYDGVITAIGKGNVTVSGKPIDRVVSVTRMNPMLVKIPFTSEIVDVVGKSNLVRVYPDSKSEAVPAWVETGDQNTIYAYVRNEMCSTNASLTPEQQKMPKAYMLFPVMHFYDGNFLAHNIEKDSALKDLSDFDKNLLSVPARAVHKDDKGEYVWRAIGQVAMDKNKGIDPDFTVEKSYVKTGKLKREFNYGANVALTAIDLEDAGSLNVGDILILYGDKSIQDGNKVVYGKIEWLFLPGETVKVEIPALTKPAFYVPSTCIVHESEGFNFVYAVENGKAKMIKVKLTGLVDETYSVEGIGIKEGTKLIVFKNKKQVVDMYDSCPVEVKETIPPCEKIEHQRATPIIPYEQLTFF